MKNCIYLNTNSESILSFCYQDGHTTPGQNPLYIDEYGNFVFGFKRKHKQQSIIKVDYESGKTIVRTININKRKYKI